MQHHHVTRGPQACIFVNKTARILFFLFFLFCFTFCFHLRNVFGFPTAWGSEVSSWPWEAWAQTHSDWLHMQRTNEDCVDSFLYYICLCEEPPHPPSCVGPWSTLSKVSCSSQMKERVLILSLHPHCCCCCSSSPTFAPFGNFFTKTADDWNIGPTIRRRDFKRTTRGSWLFIVFSFTPNHYFFCGVLVMSTKFNESVQAHV